MSELFSWDLVFHCHLSFFYSTLQNTKHRDTLFELVQRAETRVPKLPFTRAPKLGADCLLPGLLPHDCRGQP